MAEITSAAFQGKSLRTGAYRARSRTSRSGHTDPFPLPQGATLEQRVECIARYRAWLLARPTLEADLAALWEETEHGKKCLGCWCYPEPCHCDVLVEEIGKRFEKTA